MRYIPIFAPALLLFIFVNGCAITGAPAPETPREKYAAAEASYKAIVTTIDQLVAAATIRNGTLAAQTVATSLRAARAALDAWGASPDSLSRQLAALTTLRSVQRLLVDLQRKGP